jgi:site-specific recombinase XerD
MMTQFIRRYGDCAGIHPAKLHIHALKHSTCMTLWEEIHDLNAIHNHVGHKIASSTLVYMRSDFSLLKHRWPCPVRRSSGCGNVETGQL